MKNYVALMRKKQADGQGTLREWLVSAEDDDDLSAKVTERGTSEGEMPYAVFGFDAFGDGTQATRKL